jgi:uncharacterized protein YbbC (DUF1343 family)
MLTALSVLPLKAQTPAAEHPDDYIPMLKNKNIGLVANHSSRVGEKRLLDALIENGISVLKIYSPEHGFRGTATEGEAVNHSADEKTGISIISLYGANKKPTAKQLNGIDCMVFDMQDVGTRFYTYLSTMHYVMEACAENNIPLIVLDRPNPNGFYIDGPILEPAQKSFVGMHPIPIVHGMTLGELAQMINGEGWLSDKLQCMLTVITCKNYTHQSLYKLPVRPSPNLPNMTAVYLYPTLCLFEGTVLSVGRGAGFPFQVYGHPNYEEKKGYEFVFTPRGTKGSSKPVLDGKTCYGVDLRECNALEITNGQIQLDWIIDAYKNFSPQDKFFSKFFDTLSGNTLLRRQIENGKTAGEIRKSWKKGLDNFKQSRKKYLLYDE